MSKIELENVQVYETRLSPAFKRICKSIFVVQILCSGFILIKNVSTANVLIMFPLPNLLQSSKLYSTLAVQFQCVIIAFIAASGNLRDAIRSGFE